MKFLFNHRMLFLLVLSGWCSMSARAGMDTPVNEGVVSLNSEKIDLEQQRLDRIDGMLDSIIGFPGKQKSAYAGSVYFKQLDALQHLLMRSSIGAFDRALFSQNLLQIVKRIRQQNYHLVNHYARVFSQLERMLIGMEQDNLLPQLHADPAMSIELLDFVLHLDEAEPFLWSAASTYPDHVLKHYRVFEDEDYALQVLKQMVIGAPGAIRKYLVTQHPVSRAIRSMDDPLVREIVALHDRYDLNVSVYPLLDEVIGGHLAGAELHATLNDEQAYFECAVEISKRKNPLGRISLDQALEIHALKTTRRINDLHEEQDPGRRFRSVEGLSAEALYSLMVYSKEEVFTSTFNGLFDRWKQGLRERSGYRFLQDMGMNRFRSFVSLAANYGRLEELLATMSVDERKELLALLANGIDVHGGRLSDAIDLANIIAMVQDNDIGSTLRNEIEQQYLQCDLRANAHEAMIYRMLLRISDERLTGEAAWMDHLAETCQIPEVTLVEHSRLKNGSDAINQRHFFYDDDDGSASFQTFLYQFRSNAWKMEDRGTFVLIVSTQGQKVAIYANKPEYEKEGQADITDVFDREGIEPSILVHRGHSYYADHTLHYLNPSTQLLFLGSCGSYHRVAQAMERAPAAQIISTRQIATRSVNDPLLRMISEACREGNDLVWPEIWKTMEGRVANDAYANEKFADYIPPHQNLGALFIMAYRRMIN